MKCVMKAEDSTVELRSLEYGAPFKQPDEPNLLYIKVDPRQYVASLDEPFSAVQLQTGYLCQFAYDLRVIPVNAEVVER